MLETPRQFAIVNLGCKVNRVESDAFAATLIAQGARMTSLEAADLVVVNTCTVTGEAEKKTRKALRHALAANSHAQVVVTGCAVAIDADAYVAIDPRVKIVQKPDLETLLAQPEQAPLRYGANFRTRVNIKVQDGCNRACTYCIVHVARGRARSMDFKAVVAEARSYFQQGAKELVLTGIDLGSYSDSGATLAQLVEALLEEADRACLAGARPARIRASSLEPVTLDERFINLLATSEGRLCRHLHLPLQSGSTKVLSEMARPYDAPWFLELVHHLREMVPSISLTTDIICGFPGETEDEHNETMQLARACGFSKIHVFPYSMRKGTPAAARSDQIDARCKARRAAEVRALSDELRAADMARRAGTCELALVEQEIAVTESYHEVEMHAQARVGQLVQYRWAEAVS